MLQNRFQTTVIAGNTMPTHLPTHILTYIHSMLIGICVRTFIIRFVAIAVLRTFSVYSEDSFIRPSIWPLLCSCNCVCASEVAFLNSSDYGFWVEIHGWWTEGSVDDGDGVFIIRQNV